MGRTPRRSPSTASSPPAAAAAAAPRRKRRRPWGNLCQVKRKDGSRRPGWYLRYVRPDTARRTMIFAGRNKKEAVATLKRVRKQAVDFSGTPIDAMTIRAFLLRYDALLRLRLNKDSYRRDLVALTEAAAYFGDTALCDLTRPDVEEYMSFRATDRTVQVRGRARKKRRTRVARGNTPGTLRRHLYVLSAMFEAAVDRGAAATNPCRRVRLPRAQERAIPYLGPEEIHRLYAAMPEADGVRDTVVLLGETGLRRGELLELRWSAVAPDYSSVKVARSKSGKVREVPLTPLARETLRRVASSTGRGRDPQRLVLGAMRADVLLRRFQRAAAAAGFPTHLRLHDLRHAFASGLVQSAVPVPTVSALLGHQSPQLVLTRYGHHAPQDAGRRAIEALAAARGEGPEPAPGTPAAPTSASRSSPPGGPAPAGAGAPPGGPPPAP